MSVRKASSLRGRLSINPDEVPAAAAPPRPVASVPAPTSTAEGVPAAKPEAEPVAEAPARVARDLVPDPSPATPERISALDDPTILAGRRDYRSFYVEDVAFARFRAAIYWLSRREDTGGTVPENMSAAIENFMTATAEELERLYNDGRPFRMPPGQRRRRGPSKR